VLNWWVFLLWRAFEHWTFAAFFTVILWTISMYVLALALYPPRLPQDVDYRALFEANRTWFLATFTTMLVLDIAVTAIRDQRMPDTFFLVYVGHYAAITAVGMLVRRRTYDLLAAWYIAGTLALWSFIVRDKLF